MDPSLMIFLVLLALLQQFLVNINAQDCLLATNGNRALPNFVRPGGGSEPRFVKQPIQAIITSYRFNCCGVITEWGAIVERSGGRHNNGYYTITFQVWRPNSPSPVDTDGCYTMIGSNHFPNIVLDPDRAVRETPLASERIHFQPGDVIGFYLIGTDTDDNGIQFAGDSDNDSPYTEESVWYITTIIVPGSDPSCSFPVGSSGTLSSSTSLAPLITAAALMSNCPRSTSVTVMPTTSTPPSSPIYTPTPSMSSATTSTPLSSRIPTPTPSYTKPVDIPTEGQGTVTTDPPLGTDPQIQGFSTYTHTTSNTLSSTTEKLTTSTLAHFSTPTLSPSYTFPSGGSVREQINMESPIPTGTGDAKTRPSVVNDDTGLIAGIGLVYCSIGLVVVLLIVVCVVPQAVNKTGK